MVNGPPCRQCGTPLRWFPEQNAWGCDRCRQMFPPQMVQQPLQMAPQMMQQPPPHVMHQQQPQMQPGPPRKGSRKMLAIIAGLVVVAGIVVIAVVASRNSDPAAEGDTDLWVIRLEVTRDKVCTECKDDACVRTAMNDLDKLHTEIGEHVKPDQDQAAKIHSLVDEIAKCVGGKSGGGDSSDDGGGGDTLSTLEGMRVDMCNCMSESCASDQAFRLNKWMKAHKGAISALSEDGRAQALAIVHKHKECFERLIK